MKFFIQTGALLGLIGVGIGAFGAHALRKLLAETGRADTFETAVKYQFYHALALVLVGVLMQLMAGPTVGQNPTALKYLNYAGLSFLGGVLIFSGSLYVICFTGITWLGAITPIGGVLMIAGWALLFWAMK
jgi:uncharacterized membrane protein YgdD (TMEM256/DUF423 family)